MNNYFLYLLIIRMKYYEAVRIWNKGNTGAYCNPKKGSKEYDEVKKIMMQEKATATLTGAVKGMKARKEMAAAKAAKAPPPAPSPPPAAPAKVVKPKAPRKPKAAAASPQAPAPVAPPAASVVAPVAAPAPAPNPAGGKTKATLTDEEKWEKEKARYVEIYFWDKKLGKSVATQKQIDENLAKIKENEDYFDLKDTKGRGIKEDYRNKIRKAIKDWERQNKKYFEKQAAGAGASSPPTKDQQLMKEAKEKYPNDPAAQLRYIAQQSGGSFAGFKIG